MLISDLIFGHCYNRPIKNFRGLDNDESAAYSGFQVRGREVRGSGGRSGVQEQSPGS